MGHARGVPNAFARHSIHSSSSSLGNLGQALAIVGIVAYLLWFLSEYLVFETTSKTDWTSVSLDGTLTEVENHELESLANSIESNWRPAALDDARQSEDTSVYRFWIQNKTVLRQTDD